MGCDPLGKEQKDGPNLGTLKGWGKAHAVVGGARRARRDGRCGRDLFGGRGLLFPLPSAHEVFVLIWECW